MRIKNKHTGQEQGSSYEYWKTKILSVHQETNFDILSKPDIVDVFEINPNNGKHIFIESTDRYIANNKYLKDSKYTIEDSDLSKFDEYYRLKNQSKFSFLKRILKRIKQIIKPSKNPNVIPFNRFERITIIIGISAIAIAIIIPIVLFIIDKVYFKNS